MRSLVNLPRSQGWTLQHHYLLLEGFLNILIVPDLELSPTRVPQIKLNMWGVRQWRQWRCKNWYNYVVLLFLSVLLCIACLPPRSSPPPDWWAGESYLPHWLPPCPGNVLSLSQFLVQSWILSTTNIYILHIYIHINPLYKYKQETCWYSDPVKLRILHICFPAFYQIYR